MRQALLKRDTNETKIELFLDLDPEKRETSIDTGIGFFDHMLELFSCHSGFSLKVKATGDIHVDSHHTVEDVGILLGLAFKEAIGDKNGIERYSTKFIPMDETLAMCSVDISGRATAVFDASFSVDKIGNLDTEMIKEFFVAFVNNSFVTLHIKILTPGNNHHMAEAVFKAFARSLKEATSITGEGIPSSKGVL